MGAIKLAVANGVMTFGWVFYASTLGAATTVIASLLGLNQDVLHGPPWPSPPPSSSSSSGVPPSVTVHHRYKVLSFLPTEEGELATIRTALKPLSRFNVINIEAFITKAIFERGYLVKSFCKLYRVLTHHQQPDVFEQILYLSAKNSQFILPPRGHMIVDQFIGFCKLLRTGQGQEMVTEAQRLERRQKRAKERVSRRRNTPCW
ncbi:hypothetical protein CDL15_Pgr029019 [Punica granatum]|uniref:Uncharacterized protein n=1 Tax=Punica granatum TaxID=22663 RepID=A0A218XLN5_PUNGR|nr:hypothetical protein CDL15_Pgr029019 [Punica granatum]